MRRRADDLHGRSIRPPLAAVGAAAPLVLIALGATLLLSTADVPVFSLDPDVIGFALVIVGLVWLLRRLTSLGQTRDRDHEHR